MYEDTYRIYLVWSTQMTESYNGELFTWGYTFAFMGTLPLLPCTFLLNLLVNYALPILINWYGIGALKKY